MFGGETAGQVDLDEVWRWDLTGWNGICGGTTGCSGPSARIMPALAYDSEGHKTVLFGGFDTGGKDDETWEFEQVAGLTRVVRSFALHPRSAATRPLLWLISVLLRRAIARHLRQMKAAGGTDQQALAPQAHDSR